MTRFFGLMLLAPLLVAQAPATRPVPFNLPEARKSVVLIRSMIGGVDVGTGSGFIISRDGLLVTNHHVIENHLGIGKETLLVGVPSRKDVDELEYFPAEVVFEPGKDDSLDFAILKIAARAGYGEFPALPIAYDRLDLGSPVAVLGYPGATDDLPSLTFTKGNVLSARAMVKGKAFVETDAAINFGNSGGPLLNRAGEVAAVVTFKTNLMRGTAGGALYLYEAKDALQAALAATTTTRPAPGPIDSAMLKSTPQIKADAASWQLGSGTLREAKGVIGLENDGNEFWITSKKPLPENFMLQFVCGVQARQNKDQLRLPLLRRMLYIGFDNDDATTRFRDRKGMVIQFSDYACALMKDGEAVSKGTGGNDQLIMRITIVRNKGLITFSDGSSNFLEYRDIKPTTNGHPLCIGGYMSALALRDIRIIDLDNPGLPLFPTTQPARTTLAATMPASR